MLTFTEIDNKSSLWKLSAGNIAGAIAIVILLLVAHWITAIGRPEILSWLIIKKTICMILAILGSANSACFINWFSHGDWWASLVEDHNVAVGITCAGLFIGIGFAVTFAG